VGVKATPPSLLLSQVLSVLYSLPPANIFLEQLPLGEESNLWRQLFFILKKCELAGATDLIIQTLDWIKYSGKPIDHILFWLAIPYQPCLPSNPILPFAILPFIFTIIILLYNQWFSHFLYLRENMSTSASYGLFWHKPEFVFIHFLSLTYQFHFIVGELFGSCGVFFLVLQHGLQKRKRFFVR